MHVISPLIHSQPCTLVEVLQIK